MFTLRYLHSNYPTLCSSTAHRPAPKQHLSCTPQDLLLQRRHLSIPHRLPPTRRACHTGKRAGHTGRRACHTLLRRHGHQDTAARGCARRRRGAGRAPSHSRPSLATHCSTRRSPPGHRRPRLRTSAPRRRSRSFSYSASSARLRKSTLSRYWPPLRLYASSSSSTCARGRPDVRLGRPCAKLSRCWHAARVQHGARPRKKLC